MERLPAEPCPLCNGKPKLLYCFAANEAFPITEASFNAVLPRKIFGAREKCVNSCLSHARLVVKSVFRILTQRVHDTFVIPTGMV